MTRSGLLIALLVGWPPALAQNEGLGFPPAPCVAYSFVQHQRASRRQAEVQVLGKDNKERSAPLTTFTLLGNKTVMVTGRGCRESRTARCAPKMKPLGLDNEVSIPSRAAQKHHRLPKLRGLRSSQHAAGEADVLEERQDRNEPWRAKKNEGHPCVK